MAARAASCCKAPVDYDGTSASGESTITGSGTGDLAGLTGTLTSASTHDDYPNMPISLTYTIE